MDENSRTSRTFHRSSHLRDGIIQIDESGVYACAGINLLEEPRKLDAELAQLISPEVVTASGAQPGAHEEMQESRQHSMYLSRTLQRTKLC